MQKLKKCKECSNEFEQRNSLHTHCSPKCAIIGLSVRDVKLTKKHQSKILNNLQEIKKKTVKRSLSKEVALTQKVFNEFIRLRDAQRGCISCGAEYLHMYHAGHYLSVGAHPEYRFSPSNVHKQCVKCNMFLHGNLIEYRKRLILKIGIDGVEKLESGNPVEGSMHGKLKIDEVKELRKLYAKKVKDLSE